jgi:hypothetical protein
MPRKFTAGPWLCTGQQRFLKLGALPSFTLAPQNKLTPIVSLVFVRPCFTGWPRLNANG